MQPDVGFKLKKHTNKRIFPQTFFFKTKKSHKVQSEIIMILCEQRWKARRKKGESKRRKKLWPSVLHIRGWNCLLHGQKLMFVNQKKHCVARLWLVIIYRQTKFSNNLVFVLRFNRRQKIMSPAKKKIFSVTIDK